LMPTFANPPNKYRTQTQQNSTRTLNQQTDI
jgi:hypothetical protein